MVLNLSQQTDSSDLLGGFRPVQPRDALLPLLARLQARCTAASRWCPSRPCPNESRAVRNVSCAASCCLFGVTKGASRRQPGGALLHWLWVSV